jgi:hypothetical protein
MDNDFVGKGLVHVEEESILLEHTGNYATFDANVACRNIAVGETQECIAFDSEMCLGAGGPPTEPTKSHESSSADSSNVPSLSSPTVAGPALPVKVPSSISISSSLSIRYALSLLVGAIATFLLLP